MDELRANREDVYACATSKFGRTHSNAAVQHLREAIALMNELDTKGQVTGYHQRELIREEIADLQRELESRASSPNAMLDIDD